MKNKNNSYNQQIDCPTGCGGYIKKAYDTESGRDVGRCNKCYVPFCWKWFE